MNVGFNEQAVRSTVEEVVLAMRSIPPREATFPQSSWPAAGCEQAGCALAAVLEDRGLGDWLMASGHHRNDLSGHLWLVLKAEDRDFFSIDVTLHQFLKLSSQPFVDFGSSPARTWFNQRVTETRVWDWPPLGNERQTFQTAIRQVRDALTTAP